MNNPLGPCPCCSNLSFDQCCQPFLLGQRNPDTAQALMRSRFTAYRLANIDYIEKTMQKAALDGFHAKQAKAWADKIRWGQLRVNHTSAVIDGTTSVGFEADFIVEHYYEQIKEVSLFELIQGIWYYVGSDAPPTIVSKKIQRNTRCPCQSGKKFKQCCGKQ